MIENLCIDLCSGWGGFSEAFVKAGWNVVRIEFGTLKGSLSQQSEQMLTICHLSQD